MRLIRCLSLIVVILSVSGCATLNLVSFGASGISYLVSGKSLSDHVVSAMKKEDCAMHRVLKGQKTCIPLASSNEVIARVETNKPYITIPL